MSQDNRAMPFITITIIVVAATLCTQPKFVHGSGAQEKCSAVLAPNFESCAKLRPPTHQDNDTICSTSRVCRKQLHFTKLQVQPFVNILQVIVDHVLGICCGRCRNSSSDLVRNIKVENLNDSVLNSSSIVFPVLGVGSATRIYGYHYIPLIKLKSGYYITRAVTPEQKMKSLVEACANLWPLLIIMLLLCFIAGFAIWLTDTWFNEEEFPRQFFSGVYEGSWWAFVSMTTVGYGDKAPRYEL